MSHLISKSATCRAPQPSQHLLMGAEGTITSGSPYCSLETNPALWTSFSPKPTTTGTAQENSHPGAPVLPDPSPQHCSDNSMWVMGSEAADISVCSALPGSGKAKEPLGDARKVPRSQMPWAVVALLLDGMPQVSKPWSASAPAPAPLPAWGGVLIQGQNALLVACVPIQWPGMVGEWSESLPPSSSFALAKRFVLAGAQSKNSQPPHTFLRDICGHFNSSHCPG